MGMGNRNAANGSMIAGMGGFGCMLYNATGAATKYEPEAENRHIGCGAGADRYDNQNSGSRLGCASSG